MDTDPLQFAVYMSHLTSLIRRLQPTSATQDLDPLCLSIMSQQIRITYGPNRKDPRRTPRDRWRERLTMYGHVLEDQGFVDPVLAHLQITQKPATFIEMRQQLGRLAQSIQHIAPTPRPGDRFYCKDMKQYRAQFQGQSRPPKRDDDSRPRDVPRRDAPGTPRRGTFTYRRDQRAHATTVLEDDTSPANSESDNSLSDHFDVDEAAEQWEAMLAARPEGVEQDTTIDDDYGLSVDINLDSEADIDDSDHESVFLGASNRPSTPRPTTSSAVRSPSAWDDPVVHELQRSRRPGTPHRGPGQAHRHPQLRRNDNRYQRARHHGRQDARLGRDTRPGSDSRPDRDRRSGGCEHDSDRDRRPDNRDQDQRRQPTGPYHGPRLSAETFFKIRHKMNRIIKVMNSETKPGQDPTARNNLVKNMLRELAALLERAETHPKARAEGQALINELLGEASNRQSFQ
mmetsp:Transcript_8930/g.36881  ORF Transcript_8930/g.36881 Transcript_8930/m.36881 type:complete len:456 (-) Transcript_8930:885-2252(-)